MSELVTRDVILPWTSELALDYSSSRKNEFGLFEETPGVFVLYVRGADRIEGPVSRRAAVISSWLPAVQDNVVFDGGDNLWKSLQTRVASTVNDAGGTSLVFDSVIYRPDWGLFRSYFEGREPIENLLHTLGCNE